MGKAAPLAIRFERFVWPEPMSGCWLWAGAVGTHGYGVIGVGPHKIETAHRVSWGLHRGEIPAGMWVLHKCDNRVCVNPDHLYLGTVLDNSRDLMARGRPYLEIRRHVTPEVEARRVASLPRGAAHHRSGAKITSEIAMAVFNAIGPQKKIGVAFGICQQTVSLIKSKKTWGHIHADT